jgi:asparagine synthase (glutamine-hydrolysing)
MCGLIGVIGINSLFKVEKMISVLLHRGPDGRGIWNPVDEISFGHLRLSINDLSSAGLQPYLSNDDKIAVMVNGEIYNYNELKKQLESLGCSFKSSSDSEVVLHAWLLWGKDCFKKFNGMFAIAIYDLKTDELILARDRIGIKPLYYSFHNNEFVFASEIKAILKVKPRSFVKPNQDAMLQYLVYQNFRNDLSLFKNVLLLQAGSFLVLKQKKHLSIHKFWDISEKKSFVIDNFDEAIETFQETIQNAVQRHLLSDVPIASYLSGGFDSAAVTSFAAQNGHAKVCFTGSFNEGGWYSEAEIASKLVLQHQLEHRIVEIESQDVPRVLDKLIYHLDEPRMGIGAFSQYCVAEEVAKTHKVILTGHGGDELFSGYPVFKFFLMKECLSSKNFKSFLKNFRLSKTSEIPFFIYFFMNHFKNEIYKQYFPVLNSLSSLEKALLPEWKFSISNFSPKNVFRRIGTNDFETLSERYFEFYLNGLLVVEDKISMAHSLESRTPFLDNDLLDLSLIIPQHIKLHQAELKAIIKHSLKDFLPKEFYQQPKRGFPTPLGRWLRGDLKSWFIEKLTGPQSSLKQMFHEKWLYESCFNYLNSPFQNFRQLDEIQTYRMWQLLSLETWMSIYLS